MSGSIPASTLNKFTTFGDLLRFLRRRAGLTQLELSIGVGYSTAQISRLEQNLRPPDLNIIEARFVEALGLEDEPEAVAHLLNLAADVRREDAPSLGLCPYKGLSYFDELDADMFVGREALTSKLLEGVLTVAGNQGEAEARFLAIVGASGSGKSSLVRAGLVPALRWNKASADWPIRILTPTPRPIESLAEALTRESDSIAATAARMDDLAQDRRSLHLYVKRELKSGNSSHLLLVIDQFEELFTLCRSEGERAAFIDNLLTAASETDGPVAVVITLRADFYAHCANYPGLREALADQQEYIGAMSDAELRRAIEEPAARGHWEFEAGLVELLLHDVGHEPGALPLLSHALLETWGRRRGRTMTLSGYASSGGVRGAIAETAEAVFTDQFSHEQQAIARRIFLRLTELGDETSTGDTRRRATINELVLKPEEADTTRAVLTALADARLITLSEDAAEVAHEALIREWPTLRGWLEDNREGLRLHRGLTEAAGEWASMERDPDLLYRGTRLAQAAERRDSHPDELNALELEFLAASTEQSELEARQHEAQRQRELEAAQKLAESESRSASRLRRRAFFLGGAVVLAIFLAGLALFFGNSANRNAAAARESALRAQNNAAEAQQNASAAQNAQATAEAERVKAENDRQLASSRGLALAANANLDTDPELSILLSLQALSQTRTPEAETALRNGLMADRAHLTLQPGSGVNYVAYSPDGARLATTSGYGVEIWDASTGRQLLSFLAPVEQGYVRFSPDGKQLATAGDDTTVILWDASTGKQLMSLPAYSSWIDTLAFSPDGRRLATANGDHTARVWDLATGRELLRLTHPDIVSIVAFNPDGAHLLTSGFDYITRVWELSSGKVVLSLPGIDGMYTPDGTKIITDHRGGQTVWDAETGQNLSSPDLIHGMGALSPDGRLSFNVFEGGQVGIVDLVNRRQLLRFPANAVPMQYIAVAADGAHIATIRQDGTVNIWDISAQGSREWLTLAGVGRPLYSPDGSRLATISQDNTAIIWNAVTGRKLLTLRVHSDGKLVGPGGLPCGVSSLSFSPDGSRLATGSCDRTASIWDAQTGQELLRLSQPGHGGGVMGVEFSGITAVAYSPDGERLATAGSDGTTILWDATTGRPIFTLSNQGVGVANLAFSPDGARLAISGGNASSGYHVINRIWDTATGKELFKVTTGGNQVLGLAFSPDGKRFVTGNTDGLMQIWDASTGEELFSIPAHTSYISGAAFSPDGSLIASTSGDGTAKLWDASSGRELLSIHTGTDGGPVSFSPDGTRLAVNAAGNTVHIYLLKDDELIALAKSRLTRSLTTAECQKYLHVDQCPAQP